MWGQPLYRSKGCHFVLQLYSSTTDIRLYGYRAAILFYGSATDFSIYGLTLEWHVTSWSSHLFVFSRISNNINKEVEAHIAESRHSTAVKDLPVCAWLSSTDWWCKGTIRKDPFTRKTNGMHSNILREETPHNHVTGWRYGACVQNLPAAAPLRRSTSVRSGALDDPLITFVLIRVVFVPIQARVEQKEQVQHGLSTK